jgi:hypothetical protein
MSAILGSALPVSTDILYTSVPSESVFCAEELAVIKKTDKITRNTWS